MSINKRPINWWYQAKRRIKRRRRHFRQFCRHNFRPEVACTAILGSPHMTTIILNTKVCAVSHNLVIISTGKWCAPCGTEFGKSWGAWFFCANRNHKQTRDLPIPSFINYYIVCLSCIVLAQCRSLRQTSLSSLS